MRNKSKRYELQDDRTEQEKTTHVNLVRGCDTFLSGWGRAEGGKSYAAWACTDRDLPQVLRWVKSRSDMKRVTVVTGDPHPPSGCVHYHIYVVNAGHSSLNAD